MIIGTAGHIDHGKTALVRALTGIDTDRLPEEKRRGITIDLGFAPLRLTDGRVVGVVDVPGHEAFVRTMLVGASGIDLAMLIVAADEGPMPQTREHVAILTLLGVRGGVIALTKSDLVNEEWLALVADETTQLVRDTPLAAAEMVPVSSVTGDGIDALRAAIMRAADATPRCVADDLFRMPVDRVFTVRGTGTVATGTVWSGMLERDAVVDVHPLGRECRVRGLQHHGAAVDRVEPGMRAAIALAGIERGELDRGATLVGGGQWRQSAWLRADVMLLPSDALPLGPRTRLRFHLGACDVGARVVAQGGIARTGERVPARVILDAPIVARAGDRFVLRSASPVATVGGGVVADPLPPSRRAKLWPSASTPADRLRLILADAPREGVDVAMLPQRMGLPDIDVHRVVAEQASTISVGGRLFAHATLDVLRAELASLISTFHDRHPMELGMPLQSLRAGVTAAPVLVDVAFESLRSSGTVELRDGIVCRSGWQPALTPAEASLKRQLLVGLQSAGRQPPTGSELTAVHGAAAVPLLHMLEREGAVVAVESDRFYAAEAVNQVLTALREHMIPGTEYNAGDLRDLLGVSRKYLIPLLEYCDRRRITERRADRRVLAGT
jgi:selenocysteine-specific elongation factor